MVTVIYYNKSTTNNDIYIKAFSDGTVSYLTISTDDVLNSTNNETVFTELINILEEYFDIKIKEGSILE